MRKLISIILILIISLGASAQRPQAITEREYPEWFSDAKLGIFIHFGLYSVPSWSGKEQYAEWFYKGLISGDTPRIEFQKEVFGEDFKYEDYKDVFKAELFDAKEWAELFRKSGARYILFTTKHHDGYAMWNSKYSKGWNSYETGPKIDFCRELTDAVRAEGLEMGMYYSLTEWTNPLYRWTVDTDKSIDNYVESHLHPQFKELIEEFRPTVLFSDGDWDHSYKDFGSDELVEWYYKTVGPKAIVNDRWGKGFDHGYITPEYSSGILETDKPWAECRGIGRSFALNRNEDLENYHSSKEIIQHFIRLVSQGGGLTLNVGPGGDGQIPLLQQERLLDLGRWISINSEAIYGSKPFIKSNEMALKKKIRIYSEPHGHNYNWVRNSPYKEVSEDNFSIVWEGSIRPQYNEEYTISSRADDYAIIYIDNKKVLDTREAAEAKIKLSNNRDYEIRIEYVETDLEARFSLFWESKSQEKETIKSKWLESITWQEPYLCYTTNNNHLYAIAYSIPNGDLVLNLDKKPNKNMEIIFLDNNKPMKWKYKKGELRIKTSDIHPSDIISNHAFTFKLVNYLE